MTYKVKKVSISKSYAVEKKAQPGLMTSTRKMGFSKRNPVTACMPGWPAPKKSPYCCK